VARFTALLAERMHAAKLAVTTLLNINFPDLEIADIKGIKVTGLAHRSHVNSVEEGHDGKRAYYMLTREELSKQVDKKSDIGAALQGYITITPLSLFLNDRLPLASLDNLTNGLLEEFKAGGRS
jgi:5'-nucleotidase